MENIKRLIKGQESKLNKMILVIVESPAKRAKTINKYLGSEYKVLASMGHVQDLPAKSGSIDPENDFEMKWEKTTSRAKDLERD